MFIKANEHLYPIIDIMVDDAVEELAEQGVSISCKKGCCHCCYLLIEVTWEEAMELALWVQSLPEPKQQEYLERIQKNATEAKALFSQTKRGKRFAAPVEGEYEIPDYLFDDYFYKEAHPCPFLVDGCCSAYENRPSPCRLHLVSSPADYCSRENLNEDEDTEVPEEIEEVREDIGPIITKLHPDPRWGHFGIMVEAAAVEIGLLSSK